jgi:glutamyl-tRNA synthetase
VRLAVSGVTSGPGLFDILEALGKDEVISRIRNAMDKITV